MSIYGPIEAKQSRKINNSECFVEVILKECPYTVSLDKEFVEQKLWKGAELMINTPKFPKCIIRIIVDTLDYNGSVIFVFSL